MLSKTKTHSAVWCAFYYDRPIGSIILSEFLHGHSKPDMS